jgi:hypothetical protein
MSKKYDLSKYDFSAFDKGSKNPDLSKYDFSAFDNPTTEEPSKLESGLRGAAQGATLGFADELAGGGEALGDVLGLTNHNVDLGDILSAYQKHRDESRKAFKAAQEANPLTYGLGELGGGVAGVVAGGGLASVLGKGALAAGGAEALGVGAEAAGALGAGAEAVTAGEAAATGAKALSTGQAIREAALTGAKYGGIGGLGSSEADLTKGEIGGAARDVIEGAGMGGATGGTIQAVAPKIGAAVKGTKDWMMDFKTPQLLSEIFKKSKEGVPVAEMMEKATKGKAILDTAKELTEFGISHERSDALLPKSIAFAEAKSVPVEDLANDLIKEGSTIKPPTEAGKSALSSAQQALENLQGKELRLDPVTGRPYPKTAPEALVDFVNSSGAQDRVESYRYAQETLNNLKPMVKGSGAWVVDLPEDASAALRQAHASYNALLRRDPATAQELKKILLQHSSPMGGFGAEPVDRARAVLEQYRTPSLLDVEGTQVEHKDSALMSDLLEMIKDNNLPRAQRDEAAEQLLKISKENPNRHTPLENIGDIASGGTGAGNTSEIENVMNNLNVLMYKSAGKGTRAISLPTDSEGNLIFNKFKNATPERLPDEINLTKGVIEELRGMDGLDKQTASYLKKVVDSLKAKARSELGAEEVSLAKLSDESFRKAIDAVSTTGMAQEGRGITPESIKAYDNSIKQLAITAEDLVKHPSSTRVNTLNDGLDKMAKNINDLKTTHVRIAKANGADDVMLQQIDNTYQHRLDNLANIREKLKSNVHDLMGANLLTMESTLGHSGVAQRALGISGGAVTGWGAVGAGKVAKTVTKDIPQVISNLYKASPEMLQRLGNSLAAEGSPYAAKLNAAMSQPGAKRDMLLFSLSQMPGFRAKLHNFLGMDEGNNGQ